MFSERLYKLMDVYASTIAYFGVAPMIWCNASKTAIPSKPALRKAYFNTFLVIVLDIFTIHQLIRFHIARDYDSFNVVLIFGLGNFICTETFGVMSFLEKDTRVAINGLMSYLRHMNRVYFPKFNPNTSRLSYILEGCLVLIGTLFGVLMISNWFIVLNFPKMPNFPGNVILDTEWPIVIRYLICYVYPLYLILVMYLNLCAFACLIFIYGVLIVPFILLEFRVDRNPSKYFACPQLRNPPTLWNAWRTVQILQKTLTDFIGIILAPTQFVCGKLVVVVVFLIIKQGNELPMSKRVMWGTWAILGGLFWSLILLMGGYIQMYGRKILVSWKYHKWIDLTRIERKQMNKFRKSCCPLCISYGKTYVIKRLSVLKFIRGITVGIFRALLTIGLKN